MTMTSMSSLPTITVERLESPERPAPAVAPYVAEWGPCVVVATAITIIGITGVRGADYPAHFVRALLWERSGVSAWNNLWYAGHATPTYSVVAPPLMAWIGPFVTCVDTSSTLGRASSSIGPCTRSYRSWPRT